MEAWQMAAKLSDGAILAILEAHPGLRERFASIAIALADQEGNLKEADAIEERLVEEMRLLGRAAMQGWGRTKSKRPRKKFVNTLGCTAKVKKTPLAYEIWRNRSFRAAISVREGARSPVPAQRKSRPSGVFTAAAARDHRLCGRSTFRSGADQVAGALRLRDRREHDPAGRSGPCQCGVRSRPDFS